MTTRYEEVVEQVAARHDDECWPWSGGHNNGEGSYAMLGRNGHMVKVANVAYTLRYGEAPPGTVHDHKCNHKWCWNPDHIQAISQSENIKRADVVGHNSYKTHCPKDHPYNEGNTYWTVANQKRRSQRRCRACRREHRRERILA